MHLVDDLVPAYLVVTICYLISCYIYFQPLDARFFWICKQCYIWSAIGGAFVYLQAFHCLVKLYLMPILILAGFKMWKQSYSYSATDNSLYSRGLLYWIQLNLYLVASNIYLIRILCQSTAKRCVQTASTRCVFKIYNVTRLAHLCIPYTRSWFFRLFSCRS